jgi:hypothetical protein
MFKQELQIISEKEQIRFRDLIKYQEDQLKEK